jgi:tetratricopeptide (TPR) repeat protein
MLVPLATALVLSMACQPPSTDRNLAVQLARSGRTIEALAIFERIVAGNPTDLEVRLWIARLQLRMGRTEEAEAEFRAVLLQHPSDVDARIAIGNPRFGKVGLGPLPYMAFFEGMGPLLEVGGYVVTILRPFSATSTGSTSESCSWCRCCLARR